LNIERKCNTVSPFHYALF